MGPVVLVLLLCARPDVTETTRFVFYSVKQPFPPPVSNNRRANCALGLLFAIEHVIELSHEAYDLLLIQ